MDAQTTQFTAPGWRYLDGGSGYTPGGASYVSLRSPATNDYTMVVETLDLKAPETVNVSVTGGLSTAPLGAWSTNVRTPSTDDDFVNGDTITPSGGAFSVTVQPGRVYTFSTTRGQAKGAAKPPASRAQQLPLPYQQNFDRLGAHQLAPYIADVHGGFETVPCAGGRGGLCYQQTMRQQPLSWHGVSMPPTTIVGDPSWWGDYQVSADALLDQPGNVELLGRVESQQHRVAGYHLRVADTGAWSLITEDAAGTSAALASGSVAALGLHIWHRLALSFHGDQIKVTLDDRQLATVTDDSHTSGQVGLRVSGWQRAQFDNLTVVPTGPAPHLVPHEQMSATATSAHTANSFGHAYPARYTIDDRVDTAWRSDFDPVQPLPQSVTLDLGRTQTVRGLVYRPMVTGVQGGAITAYDIAVSSDGQQFTPVTSGHWEATIATKVVSLPTVSARYVRLTATDAAGCPKNGVAAEINVATSPVTDLKQAAPPAAEPPRFDHVVPFAEVTATATSQQPGFEARLASDGNCGTMWHTAFSPPAPPPHALTLDLGKSYQTSGMLYQPRQDGNTNGLVIDYRILVSEDGTNFTEVTNGSWPVDATTKVAQWPATTARYVRLHAVNGSGGFVSAAEVGIGYQAVPG